ncbi:MAG TPA: hypothetical protein VGS08_02135 [Candidatus Saccharimonadales bacterium]|nr:hypothetical protein [Candidatus Saccharimonadales bacterium]
MTSKTQREIKRFLKYWLGGGVYFWLGYGVFVFCYGGLHWNWLPAKLAADAIGWSSNYIVQRLGPFLIV